MAGELEDASGEREPDYRMSLAAERTYLAYVRTSLALLAAGVAVVGALPDAGHVGLRRVVGLVLVATGLLVTATARLRWRAVDQAMRHGRPLPRAPVTTVLTAGTLVAAVGAVALVLLVYDVPVPAQPRSRRTTSRPSTWTANPSAVARTSLTVTPSGRSRRG